MKIPNLEDLKYSAGLLEGEGSFQILKNDRTIRIGITMNDKDVLDYIQSLWDSGHIYGPYFRDPVKYPHCNPSWRWQISRQKEVYEVCVAVYPFMGIRRKTQIQKVIDWFEIKENLHATTKMR